MKTAEQESIEKFLTHWQTNADVQHEWWWCGYYDQSTEGQERIKNHIFVRYSWTLEGRNEVDRQRVLALLAASYWGKQNAHQRARYWKQKPQSVRESLELALSHLKRRLVGDLRSLFPVSRADYDTYLLMLKKRAHAAGLSEEDIKNIFHFA